MQHPIDSIFGGGRPADVLTVFSEDRQISELHCQPLMIAENGNFNVIAQADIPEWLQVSLDIKKKEMGVEQLGY